jgi:hypothetical protein
MHASRALRTSAQRASLAIRAAAPAYRGKTVNYPPADSQDCGGSGVAQIYRIDDWEYGLSTNCQLLSTSVHVSNMLPNGLAGLGLFASRSFAEGHVLGYVWGKFVTEDDWEAILTRSRDNTHSAGEENYVTPVQRGIQRVLSVPMQSNGASLLLASEQCPIAYINQGHGAATNNVELESPSGAFDADAPRSTAYQYMRAVVRTVDGRGVQRGEEFTTNYNWKAANLEEMKELYAVHLSQLNKTKVGHLRGQYDCLRAQRMQPGGGPSSVVSDPSERSGSSHGSSASDASLRRRAALERPDRCIEGEAHEAGGTTTYACCKKVCFTKTSHIWVTRERSVKPTNWAASKKKKLSAQLLTSPPLVQILSATDGRCCRIRSGVNT